MYLIIFEDGGLGTVKEINDNLLDSADDGLIDIVDIGVEIPLQYFDGEWIEIEEAEVYYD